MTIKEILPAKTTHIVAEEEYGSGNSLYRISFRVDDAFKEVKSHAGEVCMLCVYAAGVESDCEEEAPYIAVQFDDAVYDAVEQFKQTGQIDAASEVTPLSGKFLFKAKMPYYGETEKLLMYFYGFDRCDGFWEDSGLCLVYPQALAGTEQEQLLMQILDTAAESYREECISKATVDACREPSVTAETTKNSETHKVFHVIRKPLTTLARIRFWARVTILVGILLFALGNKIAALFSTQHLVQHSGNETIITEFSDTEEAEVLEAFEVIIPDYEKKAKLASFMRSDKYENLVSYVIEIDGIKDYNAFYAANSGRKLGKTVNELAPSDNKRHYYITYNTYFVTDPKLRNHDENAAAYDRIEAVFQEMLH